MINFNNKVSFNYYSNLLNAWVMTPELPIEKAYEALHDFSLLLVLDTNMVADVNFAPCTLEDNTHSWFIGIHSDIPNNFVFIHQGVKYVIPNPYKPNTLGGLTPEPDVILEQRLLFLLNNNYPCWGMKIQDLYNLYNNEEYVLLQRNINFNNTMPF